jgi:hypothetical protein
MAYGFWFLLVPANRNARKRHQKRTRELIEFNVKDKIIIAKQKAGICSVIKRFLSMLKQYDCSDIAIYIKVYLSEKNNKPLSGHTYKHAMSMSKIPFVIIPSHIPLTPLMLSRDGLSGELFHVGLGPVSKLIRNIFSAGCGEQRRKKHLHITHCNHADCLPNSQSNTRNNATVQTLKPILRIDILESITDSHFSRTVWIDRLTLHLNSDDLNRLIPSTETTTKTTGKDLLESAQLGSFFFTCSFANTLFCKTGKTESGTPISHLSDGYRINTLVDTLNTFFAVDIHECSECAWWFDTRGRDLVFCDFDRLHASAESHRGICLCDTSCYSTTDSCCEVTSSEGSRIVFGFRCDEEEDSALSGRLDPGPRNESLVD